MYDGVCVCEDVCVIYRELNVGVRQLRAALGHS
jgi:hypothetical protein